MHYIIHLLLRQVLDYLKATLITVLLLLWVQLFSSPTEWPGTDTIQQVNLYFAAGQPDAAKKLLESYSGRYNTAEEVILLGKLYYWAGDFERAKSIYAEGYAAFDQPLSIAEAYGSFWFALGKWRKAAPYLLEYAEAYPDNPDVLLQLGWIHFWSGNLQTAASIADQLYGVDNYRNVADTLQSAIRQEQAFLLHLHALYHSDDQPLTYPAGQVSLSKYLSKWWAPGLSVTGQQFQTTGDTLPAVLAQLSNTIHLARWGTQLEMQLGGVWQQNTDIAMDFTYALTLRQRLTNSLHLQLYRHYMPYRQTVSSVLQSNPLSFVHQGIQLHIQHREKWDGELAASVQSFGPDERVDAYYGWLMRALRAGRQVTFRLGYAYSYMDADTLTFVPIVQPNGSYQQLADGTLAGNYNGYFSPRNQVIHDILFGVEVSFAQLTLTTKGTYGVHSATDIPYLYNSGVSQQEENIVRETVRQQFAPITATAGLTWHQQKFSLSIQYQYQQLFFYTAHQGFLQLQYRFWKDEKH